MRGKSKTVAITGILAALSLAFSFLESLLPPLPMTPPGFKLGLSNIVSMYAAGSLGLPCALFLAIIKGGFALFTRGYAAGAMSLFGGVFSTACVWLLFKSKLPFMLIGVCGALAHNTAQLICAYLITSTSVVFYIPVVALFGIFTGALTGTVLKITIPSLRRVEKIFDKD